MADTAREDKEVVYLSGPMSGYEDWNFPAFHEAAERLRAAGYAVINPAENIGGEADMTAEWFLGLDITMIVTRSDYIVLLDGWQDSEGATVELLVADAVGLDAFEYRESGPPMGPSIAVQDVDVSFQRERQWHSCQRGVV